ncbi:MAG: hypothetical protein K2L48_05500 [Mycoplasmoidaceae bacterium]|nr:hypothetical protein [Mycoplasmoidaceae bacterium]
MYVKPVLNLLKKYEIKGMAHITGGGFIENAPRMLKPNSNLQLVIDTKSYPLPDIFKLINSRGVEKSHMYNTFNMGIGFILCVNKKDVKKILKNLSLMKEKA